MQPFVVQCKRGLTFLLRLGTRFAQFRSFSEVGTVRASDGKALLYEANPPLGKNCINYPFNYWRRVAVFYGAPRRPFNSKTVPTTDNFRYYRRNRALASVFPWLDAATLINRPLQKLSINFLISPWHVARDRRLQRSGRGILARNLHRLFRFHLPFLPTPLSFRPFFSCQTAASFGQRASHN